MKRRTGLLAVVVILLAGVLAACGQAAEQTMEVSRVVSGEGMLGAPEEPMAEMAYDMAMEAPFLGEATTAQQSFDAERLIIRTADISIVVTDTEDGMARIAALAEGNGGWVVNSYVFQADEFAKSGTITVRVPAEGFQSALDAISEMAIEVQSLSTSGQDVTEEYVDLDARLGNLEATAERVRGFLDEAETVEEALAVSSRLEGEIESIKGRMQYLSQSAAFSTITANLTPDALAQPVQIGGWQPVGVAKEALEALISGLQTLANILIWLAIYILPIALLIGIPAYLIVRAVRNRRRAKTTVVTPERPATSD
jgi:hypothetical protein